MSEPPAATPHSWKRPPTNDAAPFVGLEATPARQALRRARAPHPCRRRPDVRAHRAEVELRLPAGRPLQPRDRRALGRRQARLRPGEGGVRHRAPVRHQGLPHGPRKRVRQRLDRRDARGFGIERSLSEKGCLYDNAVIESANSSPKRGSSTASRFPTPSICGRRSTSGRGSAAT